MKEVIKTIAIVILAGVSIYFAYKFGTVNEKMGTLNSQDSLQAIQVENFDHKVHDLRLEFIGRGKHIQEFQKSVANLDAKLNNTKNELQNKINDVDYSLEEFKSLTTSDLNAIKTNISDLDSKLSTVRREANNEIMDLKTLLRRINRQLQAVEDQVETLEEKKMDKPEDDKKR